ncbi:MAG: 16S rRNA (adenine(1518)-N(6)/adenine(1519)-N(6))-dimethyltransferase RsmA [Rhodospirillales bacterium]|nr:16S rRNA (adenine(1518)-N(6)/adenine(1519)-N(6))-dimethyltransferase RsmA [Rhodospirillales bacterium]MCW9002724.1 16S rRNA (adenine(1518)-N(6)/adenine(1519)-N(6))-dimethyltransferase RsmA [Rhodospirillales bacterium]
MIEQSPPPLPPLREVIAKHDLGARKSLGQHFLLDLNLTGRIARCAGDLGIGTVIEVGPGPGGLTRALLENGAAHVVAIERDARCLAALAEIAAAYPGRLEVVEGDALKTDMAKIGEAPRRVVANLPYNISTPLVVNWLKNIDAYARLVLMFQKEVADRLAAKPGTKAYGRLSVMTQWLCRVQVEFNVDRRAFTPPPKVTSTVVSLIPHGAPLAPAAFDAMERVVAAAFNQRRKMLRQSLKGLGDPAMMADAAGVPPTARAEELTVEQFAAMARALSA